MHVYHRVDAGRPIRVVWALEELGLPYDLTILSAEETSGEQHHQRHPLGRVPVMETDSATIFESVALCLHVADLGPEGELIAAPGTEERALTYQWMLFAMTEIEPPMIDMYLRRMTEEPTELAIQRCQMALAVVENALDGHDHLVSDRFTVADIILSEVVRWTRRSDIEYDGSNITAYLDRMERRPARQRAEAATA